MSKANWTKEQLDAIQARNCNLLVAAAAGAGKTAVLVERIIKKITEGNKPVDIDKLLIVTFTNAAAAEMRERIGEAISKELEKQPDSQLLQKQLLLLNRASITTIHSFCMEVIRSNFHCLDIDPAFRIADETEALLMKLDAVEEVFEAKYEEENIDKDFIRLMECYGGSKDDSILQDIVLSIYEFVQSDPWPNKWLENAYSAFILDNNSNFINTKWAETLIKSMAIELRGMRDMLVYAIELSQRTEGLEAYCETLKNDLVSLDDIISCCSDSAGNWDIVTGAFADISFDRLKPCKKDVDKEKQEAVKAIRNEIKDKLKKYKAELLYAGNEEVIQEMRSMYPVFKALCTLVAEFSELYSSKKKEKGIIDFNDLEHFCLKLLFTEDGEGHSIPSNIALQLRERYEEIYIDEYQDSNEVQELMLTTISRNENGQPNLFMVGDIKQSIYRFRQAKPQIFNNKKDSYSEKHGEANRKILLNKNFRSRKEVLNAVNYIFKMTMSKSIGEVEYNQSEELNTGSQYEDFIENGLAGGAVELHIADLEEDEKEELPISDDLENTENEEEPAEDEEELTAVQTEARLVASRIKSLLSEQEKPFKVYDKSEGRYRRVEYRDIVILLRTTKNWAEVFSDELSLAGIPSFADIGSGYFNTVEISTIMSLLQIIDNPIQDIPLLAVLKSPIAVFSPEELIDIRLWDRSVPFYEAMRKLAANDSDLAIKVQKFLARLEAWREKAEYMATDELIWQLYNDTGYYSFAGAMAGGVQRQANLRVLFDRARQYEETSFKGLFNFINFINKLKSSSGDIGSAKLAGENDNIVKLMSIHKSKGLEFPVVFVCGMGKGFNLMDMNKSILLHQELGFGPDYIDHERRISYPTIVKHAIKHKIKLESLSEEMRILYVALTRAKEKLIITGTVKSLNKAVKKWCGIRIDADSVPQYQILKGKCFFDWICPALIRHKDGIIIRQIKEASECEADHTPNQRYELKDDESVWDIRLWSKQELIKAGDELAAESEEFMEEFAALDFQEHSDKDSLNQLQELIIKRLEWKYPYIKAGQFPVKLTVTELKRLFAVSAEDDYNPMYIPALIKKPRFLESSSNMSAAEKGTILHYVLQHLDLSRVESRQEIQNQVSHMVAAEMLTDEQTKVLNINKILKFFDSPLGKRLLKAQRIYREIPFNIELSASEVFKELSIEAYEEQKVLLQGVIDCCFIENDMIILLDYKTDYVPDGKTDELREKYSIQLEYYKKALEQITNMKVSERYIYLFWNDEILSI